MSKQINSGFVQTTTVNGLLALFGRTISVADGFSIEVFRAEKHLGTILSKDVTVASDLKKSCEHLGVRHGDTLLRVAMGAKPFTLESTFTTSDGYESGYKTVLALAVVNPKQFAIRYLSQDDPVSIAKVILKGEFRRYAELRAYDRLRRDDLDYRARHTLGVGSNKDLGLDIISVHDLVILMDPHKQKERDITRAEELIRLETTEKQKTEVLKNVFNLQQNRLLSKRVNSTHKSNEESRERGETPQRNLIR